MEIGIPRTSKTVFSHWRGCIFQGLQHLGKSLEHDSKIGPKMTQKSIKKTWYGSLPKTHLKKSCNKIKKCLQKELPRVPPEPPNEAPEPPNLTPNLTLDPSERPGVPPQASEAPPRAQNEPKITQNDPS